MRIERKFVVAVCFMGLASAACTFSADSGSVDSGETAGEAPIAPLDMEAFWAAHVAARLSGDPDAPLAILAEDAVLYEPFAPPVEGFEKVAAWMRAAHEMVDTHDLSFDSEETYHHGDWLVDWGSFSETFSLAGQEERHTIEGNYVAVLERDGGGDWKVTRFMPMPGTPPSPALMAAMAEGAGGPGP